jgi:hypothetical protein
MMGCSLFFFAGFPGTILNNSKFDNQLRILQDHKMWVPHHLAIRSEHVVDDAKLLTDQGTRLPCHHPWPFAMAHRDTEIYKIN